MQDPLLIFDIISKFICFYIGMIVIATVYQTFLWIGLIRLHRMLKREEALWKECVGKIRSAYLRKVNGEEELNELRIHNYAPLVNKLIALNFAQSNSSVMERYLLLRWAIIDGLKPYVVHLFYLIVAFWVGLILGTPTFLAALWLVYLTLVIKKLVFIWLGLNRIRQSLLIPQHDE